MISKAGYYFDWQINGPSSFIEMPSSAFQWMNNVVITVTTTVSELRRWQSFWPNRLHSPFTRQVSSGIVHLSLMCLTNLEGWKVTENYQSAWKLCNMRTSFDIKRLKVNIRRSTFRCPHVYAYYAIRTIKSQASTSVRLAISRLHSFPSSFTREGKRWR